MVSAQPREKGVVGRKNDKKKLVVFAVERKGKGISRLYGKVIPNSSAKELGAFMKTYISPEASVKTAQWTGYVPLKKEFVNLEQVPSGKKGENNKIINHYLNSLNAFKYLPATAGLKQQKSYLINITVYG